MKMYLVSNMYPSDTDYRFGIFVKRFVEAVNDDFYIEKLVIEKTYGIKKGLAYLSTYRKLFWLSFSLRENEILYVHFPLYFSLPLYFFKFRRSNVVLNFHGSDAVFDRIYKKLFGKILKKSIKNFRVVVPSNHYKKKIMRVFDISESQIYVYPSGGINNKVFRPIEIGNRVFTIGFVGNFIDDKGWQVFLDALKILSNDYDIEYRAIMVGNGPALENIQTFVRQEKLNVEVRQPVKQDELARIYASFSIFVFPTKRESLGLVGLEALMCGVPVICSKIDGPNQYIIDEYNGYFFEKDNAENLSSKVLKFIELPEKEKGQMRKNAIQSAQPYEKNKVRAALIEWLKKKP